MLTFDDCLAFSDTDVDGTELSDLGTVTALQAMADPAGTPASIPGPADRRTRLFGVARRSVGSRISW